MKTIKNTLVTCLLILSSTFIYAQEPATLTLVCTKKIVGADRLVIALDRPMNTSSWDKDYIKVIITIKMNEVSRNVAKMLVTKGRYTVRAYCLDERNVQICMPNLSAPLYINGVKVTEDISYQIFVPSSYSVAVPPEKNSSDTNIDNEVIKVGT